MKSKDYERIVWSNDNGKNPYFSVDPYGELLLGATVDKKGNVFNKDKKLIGTGVIYYRMLMVTPIKK